MNRREFLKKSLEGIVIGSIPLISCSKNPVESPQQLDYFPLRAGNSWTYIPKREYSITHTEKIEDITYFVFSIYDHGINRKFRKDENNQIIEYKNGQERVWYKFSALEGESWTIQKLDSDSMDNCVVTLISKNEVVSVPAGTFENSVKFKLLPLIFDGGVRSEWFAPGIGCIKRIEDSFAGPRTYELENYSVWNLKK